MNKNTNQETETGIQVWKTLPSAMRCQGWTKAGTTNDRTMLREIRRDLLASGATSVAFSRGAMDDVHCFLTASDFPVSESDAAVASNHAKFNA